MATYYTSANHQRDGIPVIGPRDSIQLYPEGQVLPSSMMIYLNQSAPATSYSDGVSGNYQLQLHSGVFESDPDKLTDLVDSPMMRTAYDMWSGGRNEMPIMQPMSGSMAMQSIGKQVDSENNLVYGSATEDSQIGLSIQMQNSPRGTNSHGQGLSLSLSTQGPIGVSASVFQNSSLNLGLSTFLNSYSGDSGNGAGLVRDDVIAQTRYTPSGFRRESYKAVKTEEAPTNTHSNRLSGLSDIIPTSKYLKAAQQLLDEIVDVRKALMQDSGKQQSLGVGSKDSGKEPKEDNEPLPTTGLVKHSEDSKKNPAGELSPANSQDLQNKMAELLSMLDELDRKYKLYYQQMQIVASYFDGIAGSGASKPYTKLALQTISRHFRSIRDAISSQIKAIRSSLGEEDTAGNTKEIGISRLRFVEQKVRQNRALQQLGMMQQHAWRPQRGLPETSVTILRAWLFEHFLHPYPKDSDKIILAKQTGLTRGQVSNWFINARVRLWKPMIEDMYKEEIGDSEMDSNSSSDNTPKAASLRIKDSDEMGEAYQKNVNCPPTEISHVDQFHESNTDITNKTEISRHASSDCFQEGHGQIEYDGMKFVGEQGSHLVNFRFSQDALVQSDENADGRFSTASTAYQMAELEMFGGQGGISLSLGLQHLDSNNSYVAMQDHDMYNALASSAEPNNEHMNAMDPDNQQYRFGASHSLHDFVA